MSATNSQALNLASLRLPSNFAAAAGCKEELRIVPLRKPNRHEYIRVHPEHAFTAMVLELKDQRGEVYILAPDVADQLPGEGSPRELVLAMNRQKVVFVWPLRLPDPDGRPNSWTESAMEAAALAKESWIRIAADMNLGGYRMFRAVGLLEEPAWPDKSFEDLLHLAFKGHVIQDMDHAVVRQLLGEV